MVRISCHPLSYFPGIIQWKFQKKFTKNQFQKTFNEFWLIPPRIIEFKSIHFLLLAFDTHIFWLLMTCDDTWNINTFNLKHMFDYNWKCTQSHIRFHQTLKKKTFFFCVFRKTFWIIKLIKYAKNYLFTEKKAFITFMYWDRAPNQTALRTATTKFVLAGKQIMKTYKNINI